MTSAVAVTPRRALVRLAAGGYEATVSSRAAAVVELTFHGREVFVPAPAEEALLRFHGMTLAPWPNRIVDATYEHGGRAHALAVTEPERGHALHGLVLDEDFVVREASDSVAELVGAIAPQAGYPWRIELVVRHELGAGGLRTTVTATNVSSSSAPFGVGAHPWIRVEGGLEGATLRSPARTVLEAHGERLLPGARVRVPASLDFRERRAISGTTIDHAFTDLGDAVGAASVEVVGADGHGARLCIGPDIPWVQLCTWGWPGDDQRRAIAVEPMSCPPDAFRSGDADVLDPGARRSWRWTYQAVERAAS